MITVIRNNIYNTSINRINITRKQKWEEKQLYGHFKRQKREISHVKIWTWPRKGNLMREAESLLITAQNNAIRTMLKQKYTRRNKIADVRYVVIEMKRLFT